MKSSIPVFITLIFLTVLVGKTVQAENVTTTDGREIQLNSNGTYIFLNKKTKIKYQTVDIENLDLEAENWVEKKISVNGYLKVYGTRGDSGLIGKTLSGATVFGIDLKSIPRATKRRILAKCKIQCSVGLTGKFIKDGSFDYKIIADEVIFP